MVDVDTRDAVIESSPDTTGRRKLAVRFPILIPVVVTVVMLLPFLRRAFNIDDPLFIWMAEQILKHPLDPYGFNVNWLWITEGTMHAQMQNPPLDSYFIAAVMRLAGSSELALHLAFLLPAIAVASGTFLLARRFCTRPVEATLAAILTPAFLVSGSSVMCDMMMLAFWVWSIHLWVKGMDGKRPWMILLACALITLSTLTKYYGIVLLPLLLTYSILSRHKPGRWLLGPVIPVLALVAYHFWTQSLYGKGLMLDAFSMSGQYRTYLDAAVIPSMITGLIFAGGCIASVIFLWPLLWTRMALAGWIVGAAVLSVVFGMLGAAENSALKLGEADCWLIGAHMGIFAAAGASLLVLAVKDLIAGKDADSMLLFLWLAGTLIFVGACNWTVNGRVLLPVAPVAGIVMMRQIERRRPGGRSFAGRPFAVALILSAVLAFAVAHADGRFANAQRMAAQTIHQDFPTEGTMWFQGHWGFQYYMQRLGAKPFDSNNTRYNLGDVLVLPVNNTCVGPPPPDAEATPATFPGTKWLSTMNRMRRTGFHAHPWGPIPYGFGLTTDEYYYVVPVDDFNLAVLTVP